MNLKFLLKLFIIGKVFLSYLEPGSSTFLLKILISSLVGLVVFFRQIFGYFRLLFTKMAKKAAVDPETAVRQAPPKNELQ